MNRGLKKAAVIALSSCLAMTALAGCSKKEAEFDAAAAALTVNDTTASAGFVKFFCHYTQAGVEDFYNMYFGENAFSMALDESGTTIADMTKSGAVTEITKMLLAEQNMEVYGVSLTEDEKAAITAAAEAFIAANDAETMALMCADQANAARYLELCTIQNKMEEAMGEGVDREVSDEEAAQKKIQFVLIAAETEETETEAEAETETETESAAMAEAYAKAEELIELLKDGEDFEETVKAFDEELSVNAQSFGPEDTSINAALAEAVEGLADGEVAGTPVEVSAGYYVVQLVAEMDREATDARKEEIIEDRKVELVANLYTEWEEAAKIKKDDKALAEIKFDFQLTQETEAETEITTEAASEGTETETVTEAAETEAATEAVTE